MVCYGLQACAVNVNRVNANGWLLDKSQLRRTTINSEEEAILKQKTIGVIDMSASMPRYHASAEPVRSISSHRRRQLTPSSLFPLPNWSFAFRVFKVSGLSPDAREPGDRQVAELVDDVFLSSGFFGGVGNSAMTYQPKFHGRVGSRSSLSSVGQMPIISEDGQSPLPSPALRMPQKHARRSVGRGSITPPPPYASLSPSGYVIPPPAALLESKYEGDPEKMMVDEMKFDRPPSDDDRRNRGQWHPESRHRRCRFIGIISMVMIIIVGLAVGLSLGLAKKSVTNGHPSTGSGSSSIPTGSFTLDTTLQNSSTGCTSNPTTWRCFPYSNGSPAKFYWTIEQGTGRNEYQVSSSDNPFATSFTNISMTLLDASLGSERFVFSFQMNKTVVPSSALTSTNRAAKCTFSDTTFQATLWTRRTSVKSKHTRRQELPQPGYPAWPGMVEVTETKNSTLGSPECEDDKGNMIADVQAGAGTCECLYGTPDK
ncbi:hypothetical protein PT974_06327 [Cladobotryum mycophilum]|uniref:Tat pathway signal sequence n=1 Tax=Cladobotryum mycophilum TaxID=491253 RepID=A0ABR0SL81_9HYPO